jgi:(p)ppGpp synthase/HD superfamily hydrolase
MAPPPLKNKPQKARIGIKLGPRFLRAFQFAADKHSGQTRKASRIPYIGHLMGVASLVLEAGGDEDLAIAALLHDVVEDCGGMPMLKEVRRRFGSRVAKVVDGCTDSDTDPKPPWRERKEKYIAHLKKADADTRLVSTVDAKALFGTIGLCGMYFLSTNRIASPWPSNWR